MLEECVMGYFEDVEEKIQYGYTKAIPQKNPFSSELFSKYQSPINKRAYQLIYCIVWYNLLTFHATLSDSETTL